MIDVKSKYAQKLYKGICTLNDERTLRLYELENAFELSRKEMDELIKEYAPKPDKPLGDI